MFLQYLASWTESHHTRCSNRTQMAIPKMLKVDRVGSTGQNKEEKGKQACVPPDMVIAPFTNFIGITRFSNSAQAHLFLHPRIVLELKSGAKYVFIHFVDFKLNMFLYTKH